LLSPEYRAVLDPFCREAKEIVESAPSFDAMPEEIIERAVKRLSWSDRDVLVEPTTEAVRAEVLSFYLMTQAVASVSYPYSREVHFVGDVMTNTIRYRIYDLFKRGEEKFCLETIARSIKIAELGGNGSPKLAGTEIPEADVYGIRDRRLEKDGIKEVDDWLLSQYLPKYAVRWHDLSPLLKHGRLDLTDLYLVGGWAAITTRDLWDFYGNLMGVKTEEYIQSVCERMMETGAPPSPVLTEIGGKISAMVPKLPGVKEGIEVPAGGLNPDFFPPCVDSALCGVGHGMRNFAIIMLLTSFLSYARVAPTGKFATRISDFINDISIIRDEVAPLIFEAAERCDPPFFRDQPQEKAHVFYHMGFGMTTEPRLGDSGRSKWYRVPNCSKIQISVPLLCRPDELCRNVKNPLTYYFRRRAESFRRREA
jgi:DNA primase large subunit